MSRRVQGLAFEMKAESKGSSQPVLEVVQLVNGIGLGDQLCVGEGDPCDPAVLVSRPFGNGFGPCAEGV